MLADAADVPDVTHDEGVMMGTVSEVDFAASMDVELSVALGMRGGGPVDRSDPDIGVELGAVGFTLNTPVVGDSSAAGREKPN